MTVNRGFIFLGLLLVTAGAVALAVQLGYVDRSALAGAWRLWPLVLVAIGLSIILARTGLAILGTIAAALVIGFAVGAVIAVGPGSFGCGGSGPTQLTERHGTFTGPATVSIHLDCGSLDVSMSERQAWRVSSGSDAPATIQSNAGSLTVFRPNGQWWNATRQHWDVTLPRQTAAHLEVEANAADTVLNLAGGRFEDLTIRPNAGSLRLDLADASVNQLDVTLNAGSASITVGPQAAISGTVKVNAGSVELCTTRSLRLSLNVKENITFSTNLESSGLERVGDTWSTPTAVSGTHPYQVELTIEGNAGSFTLNPEGGCD
jgi:hypothetical protein